MLHRRGTIALLRRRLPELDEQLADQLADQLGDLPLAAAQAAGYLEQTGLAPAAYLHRFRTRQASLLAKGEVLGYHGRLDTTWALSLDRLAQDSPAAVQLLQLAAFLAPEPIPLPLFTDHAELLAEPLHTIAADLDRLDDTVGLVVGYSLARRQVDRIQLHRLVQAAIRHQLTHAQQQCTIEQVLTLLAAAHPGEPRDPGSWKAYAELAPHVLATSVLGDHRPDSRQLILDTTRYLQAKGGSQASLAVFHDLLQRWRQTVGSDHPDSLTAGGELAAALFWVGEPERARRLAQETMGRSRRVLGPDHPTTLWSATALTVALVWSGEVERARSLGQDTVDRSRRVLGPDHRTTLWSAAALTLALAYLGHNERARSLGQDTVDRTRRVLGPDQPTTLLAAAALTLALVQLGHNERARRLGEDTVDRCRCALGPDQPTTLFAAAALTAALIRLGEAERARTLSEDTVERCRRTLGPDDPIAVLAAQAARGRLPN